MVESMLGSPPQVALVPLTRLHPAPWNPRLIKDERFKNLCRSIAADPEFLWRRPILANLDGEIMAGNMRYRAVEQLGWSEVPAIVEDVPEQLAKERALRDNAQWGEWQDDELAELLHELSLGSSDMELLGFDETELAKFLNTLDPKSGLTDPDDIPGLPEEPVSQPGDLWLLGDHRVLCGDATDPHDVSIVMNGATAACLWTDPPYGVSYVGKTKDQLTIQGDTAESLAALLEGAFTSSHEVLAPGAAIYIAHPAGQGSVVFGEQFLARGWRLHQTLVWVKDRLVLGHSDYHYRHEPILFGYRPAGEGRRGRGSKGWFGPNNCSSVFEVPSPRRQDEHPTSKPVELVEAMLTNSTKPGDVVLDAFLGSGSTLIACERLGRRCYGLELDARYVDVLVGRWERFTGNTAERVATQGAVPAPA